MGESLKSNTTTTELNLSCEGKRKKTHQMTSINNSLFSFHFSSTDNKIGDTGATSLSEALKSNTALTKLDLSREDKIKKTHERHSSTIHSSFFFALTDNNIRDTGATSLSESLKSNTALTELNLWSEDKRKKTHKRHSSAIHSFSFLIQ